MTEQEQAIALVRKAVLRGELPKLDGTIECVDCGKIAKQYDHRNYNNPLDVQPVCQSCNRKRGSAIGWHGGEWHSFRIRRDVLKKVDKLAEKEDRTRSSMMALLVQEALTLRNEDTANH